MSRPHILHRVEQGWQPHDGRGCPVSPDTVVRVQFACGQVSTREYEACKLRWSRKDETHDIVAFFVVREGGA